MRKIGVCAVLAAIVLMAAAGDACAAIVTVNCPVSGSGALAAQFTSGGTAGTTYVVTGPCDGSFQITQDNIAILPSSGTQLINGIVNIIAARNINLASGLMLANFAPTDIVKVDGPARVTISATIQNNGGVGVTAEGGAVVVLMGATVMGNGAGAVLALQGSTVVILNSSIGQSASTSPAIVAMQLSSVSLAQSTNVTGPPDNHTIFASQGSNVYLQNASVTSNAPFDVNNQLASIAVADSSSVTLAGGNVITNSAPGGAAALVSGGSSFKQSNPIVFENIRAPVDAINGTGLIHTQSVIELAAEPNGLGIVWTGNIRVNQGSSFRADGDNVTINGTLTLDQAANGYFNHSTGSIIDITLVKCNSTTDHVSNPTFVTPPITIGPPPGCALF